MKIVNEKIGDILKGKKEHLKPWLEEKEDKERMIKEMDDTIGPGALPKDDLEELFYDEIKKIYKVFISLNIKNFNETDESRR